jgi:hypothetical protein
MLPCFFISLNVFLFYLFLFLKLSIQKKANTQPLFQSLLTGSVPKKSFTKQQSTFQASRKLNLLMLSTYLTWAYVAFLIPLNAEFDACKAGAVQHEHTSSPVFSERGPPAPP